MNDPYPNLNKNPLDSDANVEELIRSLHLRNPSNECDVRVFAELSHCQKAETNSVDNDTSMDQSPMSGQDKYGLLISVFSTAVALMIGFLLGNLASQSFRTAPGNETGTADQQLLAGFELSDNVSVIKGASRTVIVGDSVQMQNDIPVRKLEMLTHKKIRVRDSDQQSEKEIDIPIRKIFYTLAETI